MGVWFFGYPTMCNGIYIHHLLLSFAHPIQCAECSEKTPCTSTLLHAQPSPAHRCVWQIPTKGLLAGLCNLVMAVARYTAAMARTRLFFVSLASADFCVIFYTSKRSISCRLVKQFDLAASPNWLAGFQVVARQVSAAAKTFVINMYPTPPAAPPPPRLETLQCASAESRSEAERGRPGALISGRLRAQSHA